MFSYDNAGKIEMSSTSYHLASRFGHCHILGINTALMWIALALKPFIPTVHSEVDEDPFARKGGIK